MLHVPGDMKKVRTAPLHVDGGGALQVTVAQGSAKHAPALQPNGHVVSVKE
ncbi:MAG: hypothetical protein SFW67_37440 [Myxococcaceae bacterium]|nr:hypothetical protein [Myxococcaceae bacterium]